MFLLAVFFSGLILAMENGILPGAAEIEYWKWTGVVLCLASALISRRRGKHGESAADLCSDRLFPGRFVSVVHDTMGNRNCGLLSCSALSEFHPDFPRTNDPAVSDHRRSCLYCGAASETPQTDLSGSVLHDPDSLQPQRGAGNSDRYFSVKADSGQAEGDQIRVSVLGYSNPDLDSGWGCAVSLV